MNRNAENLDGGGHLREATTMGNLWWAKWWAPLGEHELKNMGMKGDNPSQICV